MNSVASAFRLLFTHPLARRAPLRTLWRVASWQVRSRSGREILLPWIGSTRLAVRRHMKGATGNVYYGLHEFTEMGFLLHLLRPGDIFYDVGANIGSYTILAAGICGARTVAFEPGRAAAESLARNVALNGLEDLVRIERCALGATDGEALFTTGLDTMNRLARPDDPQARSVPVRRLDGLSAGDDIRFLKMDVEGAEEDVLSGAAATLGRDGLLAIVSESGSRVVDDTMSAFGFRRAYYDPFTRTLGFDAPYFPSQNSLYVRDGRELTERLRTAPPVPVMGLRL